MRKRSLTGARDAGVWFLGLGAGVFAVVGAGGFGAVFTAAELAGAGTGRSFCGSVWVSRGMSSGGGGGGGFHVEWRYSTSTVV